MAKRALIISGLCAAALVLSSGEATAQCAAKDVVKSVPTEKTLSRRGPLNEQDRDGVPKVWKTITLGEFANSFALRNALDAADCGIGDLAEEAIARPAFTQELAKTSVDLVVVTPAEFGLKGDSVPLREIYARSEKLGLNLAPAEVGPELRLQYFDQPVGEFLHVGMKPIATWSGDPVIFVVANGGAGLILIGQGARPDIQWPSNAAFLFVRQHAIPNIAKAHVLGPR